MKNRQSCNRFRGWWRPALAAFAAVSVLSLQAAPIILNVVETGGDNEPTDTIVAQWTGQTFVNGVANEPLPNTPADAPYTVGLFANLAPAYVDRNHRYQNDDGNSLPIPEYLLGGEYIMSGNDNRDNDPYQLDVTVDREVIVYMLIDNRTGGAGNATPPTIGPGTGFMEWIDPAQGWQPVIVAGNRRNDASQPDEVGIDEGADGSINQWFSVYSRIFPAGTFQLFQANNAGQNMYGVVVKEAPNAPQLTAVTATPRDFTVFIEDLGGFSIDVNSVAVELNGEVTATTNSKTGGRTRIYYNIQTAKNEFFPSGSTHALVVSAKDTAGNDYVYESSFSVGTYQVIPAGWRVASATEAGMNVGIYQTDFQRLPNENSTASAEQQWARGFGNPPHPNMAWFDTATADVVNWEQEGFNAGNFNPTDFIPGIPGFGSDTTAGDRLGAVDNNITVEVLTYLQLPRGLIRMGVNSDDGFRVSVAPGQPHVFGLTLGEFDGGRGAADTLFDFVVEEAGFYPFRLLWWEGSGGASVEWFTVNLDTGAKVLVNGPGDSIKAFRTAADRASVAKLLPANRFQGAEPAAGVQIELEDGSTQVKAGSVQLIIDDVAVTPNVTKSGTTTRVTWTPGTALAFNSDHTGQLIWTETTTPEETQWTEDFSFRVRSVDPTKDPAVLLSGPADSMLANRVILGWIISKYATQLNPASLLIQVDGANVTAQAVVSEDATQTYVTVDLSATRFTPGQHSWSFRWSDTGTKTETVTGTFMVVDDKPPIQANIAWVSFHPADDTPSADAAAAGFTLAPDVAYTQLLRDNGHTVTRILTSGTPDVAYLDTFDLVIISRSVPSGDYQDPPETAAWNSIRTPTIHLGGYVLRNNRLGYVTGDTIPDTAGPVRLKVNSPGHPIFAGVNLDGNGLMVNTYADLQTFNDVVQRGISVNTNPVATGGAVLATIGTEGDPAFGGLVIGEWQAGATSSHGRDIFGGRRLVLLTGSREQGITSQGAGIYDLSADGAKLLLNAVQYMAEPPPTPPANIAWVSFHPADDQPTADAATAGFTLAPDAGYTQLLRDRGHTVTRVLTTGTPDVDFLNTFDLVIISRSVPSGDYQDPPETALWNGIRQPVLLLNGYLIRNNRLGFTTGNTIPDTAGSVRLKVNNPAHPVFAGVPLDAQNLMVDPFANLVTFNEVVQRGISVNTDPLAGDGVSLATIGTEGDPAFGGVVVGEWQAGAAMSHGRDALGGHRMILLTGSREQGITSQGAGIFDLTEAGTRILLNAVNYMATPPAPIIRLDIALDPDGSITLEWSGGGTLQVAPTVNGPWQNVAEATSPFTFTPTEAMQFGRIIE